LIETKAKMACPYCDATYDVEMPTDYCQIAMVCEICGRTIVHKHGDCCVFCSYANKKCPPMQVEVLK